MLADNQVSIVLRILGYDRTPGLFAKYTADSTAVRLSANFQIHLGLVWICQGKWCGTNQEAQAKQQPEDPSSHHRCPR